jgi:hypothetical protein
MQDLENLLCIPTRGFVRLCDYCPAHRTLATVEAIGTVTLYDLWRGTVPVSRRWRSTETMSECSGIAFTSSDSMFPYALVKAFRTCSLHAIDARTQTTLAMCPGKDYGGMGTCFSTEAMAAHKNQVALLVKQTNSVRNVCPWVVRIMQEEGSTWKATHTIVWDCMPCRPSFSEDGLALWGVTPDRVLQKLLISTGEVVHGAHVSHALFVQHRHIHAPIWNDARNA